MTGTEATTMTEHHLMQFFAYAHLPPHLQAASKPFRAWAEQLCTDLDLDLAPIRAHIDALPPNPQCIWARSKLLRFDERRGFHDWDPLHRATARLAYRLELLLECKDCCVRAVLFKEPAASRAATGAE